MEEVDVLLVSPGTTAGWRRVDAEMERALRELGVSVATCTGDYRVARHLRRTMALTDLVEAAAMRRALTKSLLRVRPRAIVYSSTQATMLQPGGRLDGATAVRFDTLAAVNRPGMQNLVGHRLERRNLARVSMLLPSGLDPSDRLPSGMAADARAVALPVPIESASTDGDRREPIALTYAGNPEKKGLDIVMEAWRAAAPRSLRLVVTGIDAEAGRGYLRRRGIEEPGGVEWAGMVTPEQHRELSAKAEIFVAASRFEEYGIAQLEALADGALLVTVPSAGPYEALGPARELAPSLVAADLSPDSLARALEAALSLPEAARSEYRERARALVKPHSRDELKRRLERDVLPVLLG